MSQSCRNVQRVLILVSVCQICRADFVLPRQVDTF
jgi:hypothetical protein